MRTLLIAAAALLLAACSALAPSNPMPPVRMAVFADGAATLASVDTCEYEIAPLYTRNVVARTRAARALDAGRISIDEAIRVQTTTDAVRALLDRACPAGRLGKQVDRDAVKRAAELLGSLQ